MRNIEFTMKKFNQASRSIQGRADVLEANDLNGSCSGSYHSELEVKINDLTSEVNKLKPSDNPREVKFLELSMHGLNDMMKCLETHIPSMNYLLIADVHVILEHVHHQIDPSKSTLDFLHAIFKLEILTPNHSFTIQFFENALPKFFCK